MSRLRFSSLILLIIIAVICVGCGGQADIKEMPWTGEGSPPIPSPGTRRIIPEEESSPTTPPTQPRTSQPPVSPPPPSQTTSSNLILNISGSGDELLGMGQKTSQSFQITKNESYINTTCETHEPEQGSPLLTITVYPAGEAPRNYNFMGI